jgi:phosphoribosylaminoimidazole-succinocarboxamide synthase
VRDLHAVDDDLLLLVATDRISTFDVVHPTLVPDKGRVLTGLSAFWFDRLAGIVEHHLVDTRLSAMPVGVADRADEFAGRVMLCRRTEVVPFECVVRGHLAGSGWAEYHRDGTVGGIALPPGLVEADRLPEPLFTPARKNDHGHDENVAFPVMVDALGSELAERLRELSLALYAAGAAHAAERGILLADTKFEFGLVDGRPVLIDELLTPDSSRYWPAERFVPGGSPPSFDKQYVRDHVTATGWDREPPAPALPPEVVDATRARYLEAHERLTGEPLSAWVERARG